MPDNNLLFTTSVDLSGLDSGIAAATSSVGGFADSISGAMQSAADATASLQDAQKQLGAAAAAGNEQAAAIIAEYKAQVEDAVASIIALSSATSDAADQSAADVAAGADIQTAAYRQVADAALENQAAHQLLREAYASVKSGAIDEADGLEILARFEKIAADAAVALAGAKANLADVTAYLNAETSVEIRNTEGAALAQRTLAGAEETAAVAGGHVVTQMAASSAAVRVFEGNLPIRAVENFLTKVLPLGPILQAAFPIVGAIALGEILFEIGEKAKKAIDGVEQAGTQTEAAWREVDNALTLSNDALTLTNDRLDDTLAKLQKKPENFLQVALDQLRQSADQLGESLQKDIDKANELITKNQIGILGQLMGKAGTADSAKIVTDVTSQLQKIKDSYQETIDTASEQGATRQNIVDIKTAELTRLEAVYADAEKRIRPILHQYQQDLELFQESGGGLGRDTSANVALLSGFLRQLGEEQRAIGESFRKDATEGAIAVVEGTKGVTNNAIAELQTAFAKLNDARIAITGHPLTAGEGAAFWAQYLTTFDAQSKEAQKVLAEYAKYQEEMHKQIQSSAAKLNPKIEANEETQANISIQREESLWLKTVNDDINHVGEAWTKYDAAITQANEIATQNRESIQQARIAVEQSSGAITKLSADQQLAAIRTAEYTEKIEELELELRKLQALNITPGTKGYEENQQQQQQLQNQIAKVQGQNAVAAITDHGKVTTDIVAPFAKAFTTIENDFFQAQASIINGTQSVSQAFGKLGVDIVEQIEISFEKMVLQAAQNELKMVLTHTIANQEKVASDAAAAGESDSISALSAIQQVTHEAAVAAAGAWAALSGIPIIGPVLGAAAAAATYAGVLALAAFDTGGIIPGAGAVPIMGHGGERVLTQGQTNTFEHFVSNMTSNNTSTAASNSFRGNVINHFNNADPATAQRAATSFHQSLRRGFIKRPAGL